MDRRSFLKFAPRGTAALAAAVAGIALPTAAVAVNGMTREIDRFMLDHESIGPPNGRVLGLRATVDREDLAYDLIDNCWPDVKEVWFNGKKVEEHVITANERTGYIKCYVMEESAPGALQVAKERYNVLTGVMVDDTIEAWGDVRIVLDPAGRRTRTSRS